MSQTPRDIGRKY